MRKGIILLSASIGLLGLASPVSAQDDGQLVFNNACRTCHTTKAGDNRLGPTLAGIVGRKAGAAPGYNNYSPAMKDAGIVWDEATLDKFIESPDQVVPGNNMKPFPGIPSPDERQKIVAFLKEQGG